MNVVTGATGLLGSHVAEQLVQSGEKVRALVRPTSDVRFLNELGVELIEGDLADSDSLNRAFKDASIVYHCAAKVGDWGKWKVFQSTVIDSTKRVLDACQQNNVPRILHVSSVSVYGHPTPRPGELFTEEEPLGQNVAKWEMYARSKIEAEKQFQDYPGDWSMIRPSWIYGERDRNSLPRIFRGLEVGRIKIIGKGDNKLNLVYAGDVAKGAILAANSDKAIGQAYNLTSAGEITQEELLQMLAKEMGRPPIRMHYPFWLAYGLGHFSEFVGKLIRMKRSPYVTRYGVNLVGRPTLYSNEKAKLELGWECRMPILEGMQRSLQWYRENIKANS